MTDLTFCMQPLVSVSAAEENFVLLSIEYGLNLAALRNDALFKMTGDSCHGSACDLMLMLKGEVAVCMTIC